MKRIWWWWWWFIHKSKCILIEWRLLEFISNLLLIRFPWKEMLFDGDFGCPPLIVRFWPLTEVQNLKIPSSSNTWKIQFHVYVDIGFQLSEIKIRLFLFFMANCQSEETYLTTFKVERCLILEFGWFGVDPDEYISRLRRHQNLNTQMQFSLRRKF